MNDVIKELVITDVDPNETDAELWKWVVDEVLLPAGIAVTPWMIHSIRRNLDQATIQLDIPLYERSYSPRNN
jgi:hypothetical protein